MKKYLVYLFLMLFVWSCVSDYSQKQAPIAGFDYGKVEKTTYSNQFFGMKLQFPAAWKVQTRDEMGDMLKVGKQIVAESNKELGNIIDASEINSAYLFTIFQYDEKTATDFNPSLMLIVENLKGNPVMKEGKDYLANVRQLLTQSNQGYQLRDDIYRKSLDEKPFDFLETSLSNGTTSVKQEYIATILKGFSFSFILSYSTLEERKALHEILNSLTFD